MLYGVHAVQRMMLEPLHLAAETGQMLLEPLAKASLSARTLQAGLELVGRVTRNYEKPEFGLDIEPEIVVEKPFCHLLRFSARPGADPKRRFFIVAPLSGHHATLLRNTVDAFLDHGSVWVTDWLNAADVPYGEGTFGLDAFVGYLIDFMAVVSGDRADRGYHAIAVCQPGPALVTAVSLLTESKIGHRPSGMTLISAPMDVTAAPTDVTRLAQSHSIAWFKQKAIHTVPFSHPGAGRAVYPGFLQLAGFMALDPERHTEKHLTLFFDRIAGQHEAAQKTVAFYDEYWSALDMDAAFYLETIERVFQKRELMTGQATWRRRAVKPELVTDIALQTVEGGKDDICAPGQTKAAHRILASLPAALRDHHVEPDVGHYGGFAGSRFRRNVLPRILEFAARHAG
ncbi:MAG: polyhydroxyalkanoate depolymerase [Rhodospirillales bacterium]